MRARSASSVPTGSSEEGRIRFDQLVPGEETLQKIADRLEESRIIGTRVIVEPPVYSGITISEAPGAAAHLRDPPPGGRFARPV